jgi:hypothetical protein
MSTILELVAAIEFGFNMFDMSPKYLVHALTKATAKKMMGGLDIILFFYIYLS